MTRTAFMSRTLAVALAALLMSGCSLRLPGIGIDIGDGGGHHGVARPLSDRSPTASGPIAFSSAVSLSLSGWPCKRQRTLASRYFTASAARPISETAVGSFPILLLPRLPNIPLIWQVDTLLPRLVAVRARLGAATRHCLHRQNNNKNN